MVTRVRALAFPIFQKDWLYFTLQVSSSTGADAPPDASTGVASWSIFKSVRTRVENEWKAVQESKPGSFRHIARRVADWVLSQEDPTEAFFKSVPTSGKNNTLEVLYPDSYQEGYVRRHLLFTARNREKYHKAWLRVTGVGIMPLLPLALTPLPNLPIYYLGYRVYSHHQAWQGSVAVLEHLEHLETYKPTAPDPEAAGLVRSSTNLHASFDSSVTARLLFTPDADLTSIGGSRETCVLPAWNAVQHCETRTLPVRESGCHDLIEMHKLTETVFRATTPVGDEEAAALADHYEKKSIAAAVVKIRKKALMNSNSEKFEE